MKFNLEYYRFFFMTANFLSFTRAAEHLYLTQSAVSQSVRKLEKELGCSLFLRTSQGLELTKERFPDIRIIFIGSTTRDVCKRLSDGEIEVALLIEPIPSEFQFELRKVREIQDILVASREFQMDFNRVYSLEEIAGFPFISITSENSVRAYIDNWFMKNQVLFIPEYTVKSVGLVLPLVKNRLGIGIIPEDFVKEELKDGSLVQIRTADTLEARGIYIATVPRNPVSVIGQEFIRFIIEDISLL